MELNGHITILFDDEGLSVEIEDVNSGCRIVRAELDQKQTCQVMSRLACTECKLEVSEHPERIGKKLEVDTLTFPLGEQRQNITTDHKVIAQQEVLKHCPEGWTPSNYFGSQNSFFMNDGKWWARTTICRWV